MKLFEKRIRTGLFVVFTTVFLFGCSMLNSLFTPSTPDGETLPTITNVSPNNSSPLNAGTVYEFSFKCDELDVVRVSYQNPDEEIEYEYIYKENGSFKKRLWIPKKATEMQLYVTNKEGKYYVGKKFQVTGTQSFGEYTLPDSYEKANSYRTNEPDPIAVSISEDATFEATRKSNPLKYVEDVCAKINAEVTDDFKKAKIIHDILALVIPYDMEGVKQDPMPPQDYWTVLSTTKGVCQGYALTFNKFCEVIGIDCDYVFGWNRNDTHAWDIVRLDGKCYLLDTTWDAGRAENNAFNKKYSTEYLFVKPNIFAFTHFPKYQEHQLLASPVGSKRVNTKEDSKAAFAELPNATPLYFDLIENPDDDAIGKLTETAKATDGKYAFPYKIKNGINNSVLYIKAAKGELSANTVIKYDAQTKGGVAMFSFPEAGTYNAKVLVLENGNTNGTVIAQFNVEADKASTETYADTYTPLALVNSVEGTLKAGQTYEFSTFWAKDIVSAEFWVYCKEINGGFKAATLTKVDGENLYTGNIEIPAEINTKDNKTYKVVSAKIVFKQYKEGNSGDTKATEAAVYNVE